MFRNFFALLGLFILVALFVSGCMADTKSHDAIPHYSASAAQDNPRPDLTAYRLGAGDQVSITVFGEPNLSGSYELDGRGVIDMPLISQVSLGGLTSGQAVELIKAKFSEGYLQDPSITFTIKEYRPFFVMGEVRSPGRYTYQENLSVLEAVALAQGFTYRANQNEIEILRKMDERPLSMTAHKHSAVMPGDVIKVKERFF